MKTVQVLCGSNSNPEALGPLETADTRLSFRNRRTSVGTGEPLWEPENLCGNWRTSVGTGEPLWEPENLCRNRRTSASGPTRRSRA
ncbi:hypothetical protein EYF80_049547 [Liparis tanakae]|uniref:Uncharacterized protein n=1 Tax=Liparis tanakae TaxID=230148 RepID=A0A4Z2FHB5_9TELE|nr:hypothetical protein EYF80_049547 [Liparis tanakae]